MRFLAGILVITLSVAVAMADASPTAPATKDPTTATLLSLAGVAAPTLLLAANKDSGNTSVALVAVGGLVFLPSAGHWYAGKSFTAGLGMRLAGGAVSLLALSVLVEAEGDAPALEYTTFAGLGLVAAGTVYDVVTAGSAAHAWNRKHAVQATVLRTGNGYGLGVVGRF